MARSYSITLVMALLSLPGCADHKQPPSPPPKIVEVFACSDLCPGHEKQYIKRVYEGVTDPEECAALRGSLYSYQGWKMYTVCEVKRSD